jgi:hypothetical protein
MDRRVKHSKIKNTGILFELLTRQITADILNSGKSAAIKLIKTYFKESTELGKEIQLYNILVNKNFKSETRASYLVDAVVKSRKKINFSQLRREKYNLIKEIKENYNLTDFFNSRISNYRVFASIYKLFSTENKSLSPDVETDSRYTVIEHITQRKITSKEKEVFSEEFKGQDDDLRLLSYQILVDKFNQKYSFLNSAQRKLLKEYINNVSNTNSLREYVDLEVSKVTKVLKTYLPKIDDKVTKIKLTEAMNQIKKLKVGKIVKDKQIVGLMRYYELVKELKNVVK